MAMGEGMRRRHKPARILQLRRSCKKPADPVMTIPHPGRQNLGQRAHESDEAPLPRRAPLLERAGIEGNTAGREAMQADGLQIALRHGFRWHMQAWLETSSPPLCESTAMPEISHQNRRPPSRTKVDDPLGLFGA